MRLRRASPGTAIKAILGVQFAIGVLLVSGDLSDGWQGLRFAPPAPHLDRPVSPGDQTRRYRPDSQPAGPETRPFPATTDMPDRLTVTQVEIDGQQALRLVGRIAPGDGARLTERLAEEDMPDRIYLHSPGGSVSDALDLGRSLREAGFSTWVAAGDICLSACPYLLAAGVERHADAEAFVGVHQHYFGENTVLPAFLAVEDIQRGQGLVMAYLDEMGVDLRLMQPALLTPPEDIYVLLPQEMQDFDLVTGKDTE